MKSIPKSISRKWVLFSKWVMGWLMSMDSKNVRSSELIEFENGVHGVAMNLEESNVGVILLDNVDKVTENMTARRTGRDCLSSHVGEGLLGAGHQYVG